MNPIIWSEREEQKIASDFGSSDINSVHLVKPGGNRINDSRSNKNVSKATDNFI